MKWILIIIFSIVFILISRYIFKKLNILDKPGIDVPKRNPVPTIQGISLYIGSFLTFYIFFNEWIYTDIIKIIYIIGGIIVLTYLLDDYIYISPWYRLIIQFIVASLTWLFGGLNIQNFLGFQISDIFSYILTVFFLVIFMNAINWFDGINGLASGNLTLGFLAIILLLKFNVIPSFDLSQEEYEKLLFVVDISLVFFIWSFLYFLFELKPLLLLRDVGIIFLGYVLGYLALFGGAKIGTILVVLSLVIFDFFWVIFYRFFILKKNPLRGDYTHLHHRLLKLGLSRKEVLFIIIYHNIFWFIIILLQGVNTYNKIIIGFLMFLTFYIFHFYFYIIKKHNPNLYSDKYKT